MGTETRAEIVRIVTETIREQLPAVYAAGYAEGQRNAQQTDATSAPPSISTEQCERIIAEEVRRSIEKQFKRIAP